MRTLVRILAVSGEELIPIAEPVLKQLVKILSSTYKNVGSVAFAHWLFEAISALISSIAPNNPAAIGAFETMLFPLFQAILSEDIEGMS